MGVSVVTPSCELKNGNGNFRLIKKKKEENVRCKHTTFYLFRLPITTVAVDTSQAARLLGEMHLHCGSEFFQVQF